MTTLLSTSAKTDTSIAHGFLTGILYFPPAEDFGAGSSCPGHVLAKCKDPCLVESSGRMGMPTAKAARMWRWTLFTQARPLFLQQLHKEIYALELRAAKNGFLAAVRLNGGSDINWLTVDPTLFSAHPNVQFYEYTKYLVSKRYLDRQPSNMYTIASYSGIPEYQPIVNKALANGMSLAVVFRGKPFPATFLGLPVVDGDAHDLVFLHKQQCVVGLKAKGRARRDATGFVVDLAA